MIVADTGDFKKFICKRIIEAIINNGHESRKEWMIRIFSEAGKRNSRNTDYQFCPNQKKHMRKNLPAYKLMWVPNQPIII